jgi:type II secretory pathway pseudopilin PulG/cytoskeletal protein CcmA (bactofilin family)
MRRTTWTELIHRARNREEGFALVTAVVTLSIVSMIAAAVITLSAHGSRSSAYDRNRLLAVNAAEAGLDDYYAAIPTSTNGGCDPVDRDLPTTPTSHYHRAVVLYSTWPPQDSSVMTCQNPLSTQPLGALITSTGTAVASSTTPATRTMESLMKLAPYYGSYNNAIFSDTGINLVNQLTDNGFQGHDADVYTNGNYVETNNVTIDGSVYAQGYVDIRSSAMIRGDIWANGYVSLDGQITVYGRVRSSAGSVLVDNSAHVYGSARAATTVSGSGVIDGTRITNSPTGPPPALALPHITYDPTDWTSQGYTIQTYSTCSAAQTFINALPSGNYVVRITPSCALTWGNNSGFNLQGNLAIITDGSVTFQNRSNISGSGGIYKLFFIRPWVSGLSCDGGNNDISFSNNTNFNNVYLAVYTQCTANMANQNGQIGQIFAGTVNVTNQMSFTYFPILFPGAQQLGYDVFISYIREVTNS